MRRAARSITAPVVAGAVLAAVGLSVASCSSSPGGSAEADGPDLLSRRAAKPAWPEDEERLLHLAEETLISRCMADAGFEYAAVPRGADPDVEPRPYGFDDPEEAAREGYGLEPPRSGATDRSDGPADLPPDPNAPYRASLSPERQRAYDDALTGPPGGPAGSVELPGGGSIGFLLGGCVGEAQEELYGDVEGYRGASAVVSNLLTPVQRLVLEHEDYRAALAAWQDCMDQAGYDVDRSSDAIRLAIDAQHAREPAEAKRFEIAIAVQDATCSVETGLVALAERLEAGAWAVVLEEHAGVVAAYEELRGPALERARRILEGS